MPLTSVCSVARYLLGLVFCLVGTNQQLRLGPRGFLGQRSFRAKTGTVPGKPGQLVTLHAIFIISLIPIYLIAALIHFANRLPIGSPRGEDAVADRLKSPLYVLSIAQRVYFHWREALVFVSFSLVEIQASSLDLTVLKD